MAVSDHLEIDFADMDARRHGFAIAGGGLLLAIGDRVSDAPPPVITERGEGPATVAADGACEVSLEPLGAGAPLGDGSVAWICRASGTLLSEPFEGFGTLVRGAALEPAAQARSLSLRLDSGLAVVLGARRGPRAGGHGEEELDVVTFRGEPAVAVPIARPRLSTTYDGDGRVVHCGLELWESDEAEFPERIGGEASAHGELTRPDGTRTRVAFLTCHGDGHPGAGRYAITTPA